MTTFDKTLDIMENEFVGLTHEEKFAIGQKRGFFSILESEADNQIEYMRAEYKIVKEKLEKMQDKINYLIKLKQQQQQAQ